jgi:hypothetical protein
VNKDIIVESTTDRLPICKTQKTKVESSYITSIPVHLLHLVQWRVQK